MGNKGYVRVTGWCVKCRRRRQMKNVAVEKEKTRRGFRNVASGWCGACATKMRKIMPLVILGVLLGGCAYTSLLVIDGEPQPGQPIPKKATIVKLGQWGEKKTAPFKKITLTADKLEVELQDVK